MPRSALILACVLAPLSVTLAQGVTSQVSPRPAPLGARISNRFCNRTGGTIGVPGSQMWQIRALNGTPIFAPPPSPFSLLLLNNSCTTFTWDQRDNGGQQVPAGLYLWDVNYILSSSPQVITTCFEITDASVTPCFGGAFPVGCPIRFTLQAPRDANLSYFAASALGTSPPIAIDACREVPLTLDGLLLVSLCGPAPVFVGYCGTLDGLGTAQAGVLVPPNPALTGLSFATAFITVDGSGLRTVSAPTVVTLALPMPPCPCP